MFVCGWVDVGVHVSVHVCRCTCRCMYASVGIYVCEVQV